MLVPDYAATDVFVKNIHSRTFPPPGDISENILDIGYRSVLDISESILDCETFLKLAYTITLQLFSAFWDFSLVF